MKLTKRQRQVLEAVPLQFGSSIDSADLAYSIGDLTHWIASTVKSLEQKGLVRCIKRGGQGLPSKWQITDAGRSLLNAVEGQEDE